MATSRRLNSSSHDTTVSASFTPGPAGYNDASDPELLRSRMGDTQGPLGAGRDHADPHAGSHAKAVVRIPILALDSAQVHRFLRSVAVAEEQDRKLQLRRRENHASDAIDAIDAVLFWKSKQGGLGTDNGRSREVEKSAAANAVELLKLFVAKASAGPAALKRFLEAQARIRAGCLASLRDKFNDISSTNAEVRRDAAEDVRVLAKIKLGSDLFLLADGLESGESSAIGLGYDVITGLVGSWDKAEDAQIIAVSKPVGMEAGKRAAEKISESVERKILEGEGFAPRTQHLGELMGKSEKDLIGKQGGTAPRLSPRIRMRASEADAAGRFVRRPEQSAVLRKALGKLNYLFIAYPVYDTWYEYRERLEALSADLPEVGK